MWLWDWEKVRGWKNSEAHERNSLHSVERTTGTKMDIKAAASEGSEGSKQHDRENSYHFREYLNCYKRPLTEIWTLKGLLLKAWKEMVSCY